MAVAAAYWYFIPHSHSIEAYCQQYRGVESSLDSGRYSTIGLSSDSSGDLANGLAELERHAPNDIRPDLTLLINTYRKIDEHPAYGPITQEGADMQKAGDRVKTWTDRECSSVHNR
jgi:hypothetical protein